MGDFILSVFAFSILASYWVEGELLRLLWQHRRDWAEQHQIPRDTWTREGKGAWMLKVLRLDPELQISCKARRLAISAALLDYGYFACGAACIMHGMMRD